jgi:hypothetical protein
VKADLKHRTIQRPTTSNPQCIEIYRYKRTFEEKGGIYKYFAMHSYKAGLAYWYIREKKVIIL